MFLQYVRSVYWGQFLYCTQCVAICARLLLVQILSERSPPLSVYHSSFEICEISLFLVSSSTTFANLFCMLCIKIDKEWAGSLPRSTKYLTPPTSSPQSPCSVMCLSSECWLQHEPICVSPWWCTLPVWRESRYFNDECRTRWQHICPLINGCVFVQFLLFDLISY